MLILLPMTTDTFQNFCSVGNKNFPSQEDQRQIQERINGFKVCGIKCRVLSPNRWQKNEHDLLLYRASK